jgi:hypothetical protein
MPSDSRDEKERLRRDGPQKHLEICPKCGGYMRPRTEVQGAAARDNWKHDGKHRSFGGMKIQVFVCERCHHTQTVQVDIVGDVDEDE